MNFIIDPLIRFDRIEEIFKDNENAFSVIQKRIRQLLSKIQDEGQQFLDDKWLMEGGLGVGTFPELCIYGRRPADPFLGLMRLVPPTRR